MRRILERWQSRKHQPPVSLPRQQLCWQNLSDATILELWGLLKACNFQGKAWSEIALNFVQFQLLAQLQLLIPHLSTPAWQLGPHSQSSLHIFCRSKGGQKDSVLKNTMGLCFDSVIVASGFRGKNKQVGWVAIFATPASTVASSSLSC